ncbi:MAG: flagellar basal body rod protein FlgB [Variibacter sp.]
MSISDLPILSMLRTRMQWHQARQGILAENVANADTPKFRPHDLAPPDLSRGQPGRGGQLSLASTNAGHLQTSAAAPGFENQSKGGYQVRPSGNAVNLEDEMIKVAANQMDYQAAAALYSRSLALIKTALGKK